MDVPADLYFDEWTFRRQASELLRNGVRVRLQEQPLLVLDELLARPGDLVTREHLIARLWPKRIVEFDAALNAAVRRLRAALGDEAETPRYIETVPRKGYRFIGMLRSPVFMESAAGSDAVFTSPQAASAVELQPLLLTEPSLLLRRVGGRYPAAILLAAAVAVVAFGVFAISQLRGSNAADARTSTAINEPLRLAHFFIQRRAPGDLARAKQQYELASSRDPSSARAWAGLASVHWLEMAYGEQPREINLPKVRSEAQKALDLDPRLAEAHLRMSGYLNATGNHSAASDQMAKAAALEPNDPLLLSMLAGDAADEGRWEEAIVLQRRVSAAEPLSAVDAGNLASYLFLAGRIEEAKVEMARVLELDPTHPDEINVSQQILERRYDEALRRVEMWRNGIPRDQSLALLYYALGRSAEADERLAKLIATAGKSEPVRVAEVYAFRGETDTAFKWLHSSPQLCTPPLLLASPFLKPLRADSRWAQVTARKN